MVDIKQLVTIKGTKEGLIFHIDDSCSFDDAFLELSDKMKESQSNNQQSNVSVIVKLGYRFLKDDQEIQIRNLLEDDHQFTIQKFDSAVVRKKDVEAWREENGVKSISRTVRSGQVLSVKGDLLLVGNVNPGGKVEATGNIYVMGSMLGVAHAGIGGNERAIIAASFMSPSQLRIADYISRSPDYESDGVYQECGFIDSEQNQIIIEKLHVLPLIREELSVFERRIVDG